MAVRKKSCNNRNLQRTIKKIDVFGEYIHLKADGESSIKSWPGVGFSLIFYFIMITFTFN